VNYTSSLPRITTDFPDTAPMLKDLTLESYMPDGIGGDGTQQIFPPTIFPFPALECLAIDGYNFADLCEKNPFWAADIHCYELSISQFKAAPQRGGQLSLIDGLVSLSQMYSLVSLTLTSLEYDDTNCATEPRIELSISLLEVRGMSSAFLSRIAGYAGSGLDSLALINCQLNHGGSVLSYRLVFQEIDSTEDLRQCLTTWEGSYLFVASSASFNDEILEALTALRVSENRFNIVPELDELILRDCDNFSIPALRQFVEARIEQAENFPDEILEWDLVLTTVEVSGRAPPISTTDIDWFRVKLKNFSWNTTENRR
jgi:hypothetical protein